PLEPAPQPSAASTASVEESNDVAKDEVKAARADEQDRKLQDSTMPSRMPPAATLVNGAADIGQRAEVRRELAASAPASMLPQSESYVPPVYQQPADTEKYQHQNDNPVHLASE